MAKKPHDFRGNPWQWRDCTPDDPLLARLLAECGCSHLLSFLRLDVRVNWLERHGETMKKLHGLREAKGGFMVGQKWMRWSDATAPVSAME